MENNGGVNGISGAGTGSGVNGHAGLDVPHGVLHGLTVVGIPTRNEAPTIAAVARAADEGLAAAGPPGAGAIVLADNGSTDGTVERFLDTPLNARKIVVQSDGEGTGKGTNVFALIERSLELGAERLVLLDGDVRSVAPDWVGRLAGAADGPEPTMALPVYRRNRYEATSTNHLVRPLLAGAFGAYVQQPIGGDFAFNRAFLERVGGWTRPTSASLYGIDVWLTANTLRHGHRIAETPLGRKTHNSPFPKILYLPQQVLDSLFHVIAGIDTPRPASLPAALDSAVDEIAVRQDPELVARIIRSVGGYVEAYRSDIEHWFPSMRDGAVPEAPWGLRVTTAQWPLLLADALETLAAGEFERARDHLIALCVNRVMTFWDEIEGLDTVAVDELLHQQAVDTAKAVAERCIAFTRPDTRAEFSAGRWAEFQTTIAV